MPTLLLLLDLAIVLISNALYAMPDDRDKLIELSADTVNINQKDYNSEYDGNITLDQGSTHLRAAHAVTHGTQQNRLVVAIAYGQKDKQQAHYWTQTDVNKPLLHAYADTIRYYPERHLIELVGHAKIIQGSNKFTATQISFDTVKQHIFSKKSHTQRTLIVFHPDKKINLKL